MGHALWYFPIYFTKVLRHVMLIVTYEIYFISYEHISRHSVEKHCCKENSTFARWNLGATLRGKVETKPRRPREEEQHKQEHCAKKQLEPRGEGRTRQLSQEWWGAWGCWWEVPRGLPRKSWEWGCVFTLFIVSSSFFETYKKILFICYCSSLISSFSSDFVERTDPVWPYNL